MSKNEQKVVLYWVTQGKGRKITEFTTMAIVQKGREYWRICYIDTPVRLHRVPLQRERAARPEEAYMTPQDYPVSKAKKAMRRAGKRLGITKEARAFLRG